jgi:aspartyl-tRNA synthetase
MESIARSPRRTHACGELRATHAGGAVRLNGWVHRVRDHGGVLFVDLRDLTGLVQAVFHPEGVPKAVLETARSLKSEFVASVEGKVARRPPEMVNPDLDTGEVEVLATDVRILNPSRTPPFPIEDEVEASEDLRLRYRYLDLRRPALQKALRLRHRVARLVRDYMDARGFVEIETPLLVRPTPEGARDYLVPSRLHPRRFYALPQSPQIYKQILMVSGFDRYYQIARCLRDEDLRADRQPEHTQIDIEMSFVTEEDVFELCEGLFSSVTRDAIGVDVPVPFPRLTYREAMDRFGTDKPDLRIPLEIRDVGPLARETEFQVFRATIEAGGVVRALRVAGGAARSRKEIEELEAHAKRFGAKGLAWCRVKGSALDGGIAKFFGGLSDRLRGTLGAEDGDLLLFVADHWEVAARSLGAVRSLLGEHLVRDLSRDLRYLWVREFPLFHRNDETGGWEAEHHIFTMPLPEHVDLLESDPGRVHGQLYDLVVNGTELASGSIRIHRRDLQERVLRVIGMSDQEAERRFGFLLEAFQYGAPPHGGIAPGLDRFVMILAGLRSIRDVQAFPKTASALSLMDGSPGEVREEDLRELHLRYLEE